MHDSIRGSLLAVLLLVCGSAGAAEAVLRTPAAFSIGNRWTVGLYSAAVDSDRFEDLIAVTSHDIVFARGGGDGTFSEYQRFRTDGRTVLSAIGPSGPNGTRLLAVASYHEETVTLVTYRIGAGDPSPAGSVTFVGGISELSVADADGDRLPDVIGVSSTRSHGAAFLCRGTESGSIQPPRWFVDPFRNTFLRDVDGDGRAEIVATDGSDTYVRAMETPEVRAVIRAGGRRVSVADTDGDARPDLVFETAYSFTVVRASGADAWTTPQQYPVHPGGGGSQLAFHDVDVDGVTDVVAMEGARLTVHLGQRGAALRRAATSLAGAVVTHVALGDFDGDGRPDAAWSGGESGKLFVARGNGDGTFDTHPFYRFEMGIGGFSWAQPMRLFATDLTGDSRPDVVAFGGAFPHIEGLRNDGQGRFTQRVGIPLEEGSQLFGVADVDRDGKGDLVTADDQGMVAIHRGRGDMTFAAPARVTMPAKLAGVADFDGDGAPDLMDAAGNVQLNEGNGQFRPLVANALPPGCTEILFADFSGDGGSDVLCYSRFASGWSLLLHDQNGRFRAPVRHSGELTRAALGDLNRDRRADVVDVRYGWATVLLSTGDGTFLSRRLVATGLDFGTPFQDTAMTIADFDGDGLADLAVARTILFGDGNGGLGAGVSFDSSPQELLVAADVDGNGSPDLLTVGDGAGVDVLRTRVSPAGSRAMPMQLTGTPNPSQYGQEVAVTADMTLGSLQIPTARTGLFVDGAAYGSVPAVEGKAVFAVPFEIGRFALRTEYRGDGHFADVSAEASQTVNKADVQIVVEVRPPPVMRVGESRSFRLAVHAANGSRLERPGGEYWLAGSGQSEIRRPLAMSGYSVLPFSSATAGRYELRIHYGGDDHYLPGVTGPYFVDVVARKPPSISAQATVNGGEAEIVVTLHGDLATRPVTGNVTFRLGGEVRGVVAVNARGASLRLTGLPPGTHQVVIEYGGDADYAAAETAVTFTIATPAPRRRSTRS